MVAMKALIAILPFFLSMTTAMPQDSATNNMVAPAPDNNVDLAAAMAEADTANEAAAWNVSSSDSEVIVNFYKDKNPAHNTIIDASTCKGQAEIALMKWRSNCKAFNAIFRGSCYTHAPSDSKCCPLPKSKSCKHYWPAPGEWQECKRMRQECGIDCDWKTLTPSVQWCWKYAPDI